MKRRPYLFSIFILVMAISLTAVASIEVNPSENFGDVELGSSASAVITIQNVGFTPVTIDSISLESPGGDFAITSDPVGTELGYGESTDVVVTFSPSVLGAASATLTIGWTNGETGTNYVELSGTGVGASGEPVSIQDILVFFDQSVADGSLVGNGPGKSADGRRRALRNMIDAAGDLIEDGAIEDACLQLLDAYNRCDGLPRPPDFVSGPAAPTLAAMILDIILCLGC